MAMQESLSNALGAAWARNLETQLRRVSVQESAIVAALAGTLDAADRQFAASEAHKLAGSLGSYGLPEGSRLANELESAWSGQETPDAAQLAVTVAALVRLLREHAPADPNPVERNTEEPSTDAQSLDVLLVDDDDAFAEFALEVLQSSMQEVRWISDGITARDAVCRKDAPLRPRVILLDVEMPGLDGFGVLEEIVRCNVNRESAVVMLTRRTMAEDIVRARRLGAVDYLAKPLAAETLVQRVKRALPN